MATFLLDPFALDNAMLDRIAIRARDYLENVPEFVHGQRAHNWNFDALELSDEKAVLCRVFGRNDWEIVFGRGVSVPTPLAGSGTIVRVLVSHDQVGVAPTACPDGRRGWAAALTRGYPVYTPRDGNYTFFYPPDHFAVLIKGM